MWRCMNSSSKSRPAFYGESPGYDTASEGTQLTCFHCVQSVKDEDANAARKTTTNYLTQCPQRSWIKFFAENFQPVIGPCSRYLEGFGSFPAFVEVIVDTVGVWGFESPRACHSLSCTCTESPRAAVGTKWYQTLQRPQLPRNPISSRVFPLAPVPHAACIAVPAACGRSRHTTASCAARFVGARD